MKNLYLFYAFLFPLITVSYSASAQQDGDTLLVEAFNYNSQSRDTVIEFPNLEPGEISQIIMKYSLRCKDGDVNITGGNSEGCGEFALNCNTFIHDLSRTDSVQAFTASHEVAGFEGAEFNYVSNPTFEIFPQQQQSVEVTNVISEDVFGLGNTNLTIESTLPTQNKNAKTQYLITSDELNSLNFSAGELNAIELEVEEGMASIQQFRCRMKPTTKTNLDSEDPDLS